eukprot:466000-Prymnesium_polylepis.1
MERGRFGNVVRETARLLAARCARVRSLGGRCRGSGWCGRAGSGVPARDGVLFLDGDGRTFRHEVTQEAPIPAARARRQDLVISA